MRATSIVLLLLLFAAPALADVVILESNDIPLTGVILSETESSIEFQIRGLGDKSCFTIQKDRIRKFWREGTSRWEFRESERAHQEALERVTARQKKDTRPPPEILTFDLPEDTVHSRSSSQVRADLISRAVDRLAACVPSNLPLQGLMALGGVLILSLLICIGGKVADLPSLSIQRSLLLAFMAAAAVVALTVVLPRLALPPGLLPALILAVTLGWLVAARFLGRGRFMKGMIMLSFVIATIFVAGSSLFGILAVV